ncbi:hemolysin family protein [Ornithinimicrobium cerasi]|uniref:Hemolysin, contains CBS domains n=1 Tax=Ornithinimicrobium cerasi TaxID=2248773 RepID=A0A285VHG1_9MICO|nr:hemolysin family protein [Ornithinimicrobium cerasi]SOC53512.1 Hemolysin, contains CBS domains [Ornithinimicrobium cerasi]
MTGTVLLLLAGILVILAIIAVNGYFVAQEFAYMSVDRNRLAARAREGDAAAERALRVTRRTSFMLSGAQLGITVTGLLVGFVAEPMVGSALGDLLGGAGVPAALSITIGTVATLAVATVVQMLFGELYPKNLAIANADPMARGLARSTLLYLAVFGWLIAFFDRSANLLLRLVRIEPIHDLDTTATAEDLERIVADSRESGDLPHELSMLLDRILDFPDRDVEHAMIPRSRVDVVEPGTTLAQVRALMAGAHTRYPVIDEDDAPLGVVHLGDVLSTTASRDTAVTAVMRPAVVVPTVMTLPAAAEELVSAEEQLACVIDEYGGFAGILTIEDLAEELVGEITDEHDADVPESIVGGADGEWRMDGDVHLDEVERAVGHRLPEGDVETVAGLVIAQLGELPEEGRVVVVDLPEDPSEVLADEPVNRWLEIEVLEVTRHVPSEVRVRLVTSSGATPTTAASADPEEDR